MFNLSNRTYDILRWVVGVVLPALAALYAALAPLFGLPYGEQIPATVMAAVLFLGAFLQMSSAVYAVTSAEQGAVRTTPIADYPFKMAGEFYDTMKWLAQVAFPAISVAYVAFADIWGLMYQDTVTSVIAALVVFMSTILQFSSANYARATKFVLPE